MEFVTTLPKKTRVIENEWIPMSDGRRLAARLWLPEDAEQNPVPAILEYIPYRKRDLTRARDEAIHPYFAGHGYACLRVDLRGSGDSDGVLRDEYLEQELIDGEEVLRWIAAQSWCDGKIGMMGISWGGFNSLQLAARRPPELGAVIALSFTDDRYADDVHYMGGCLLGDNLSWASVMFSKNACPPDPEIVGDAWKSMWLQRLRESGLWLEQWLEHQWRDEYWRHGSVCEDFSAIRCPVMAASGWADGYSNAVFRVLEHLEGVPRQGLIGPWSHRYPHLGVPGPAIGFLQEALRWWDRWLKGIDTGIEREPMLRVWMQDSMPPTTRYERRHGRWVAEPSWPSPNIEQKSLTLDIGCLVPVDASVDESTMSIESPLSVGLFAGKWCSYSYAPDLPHDQREEDGGALVFDTEPLTEPIEILGAPELALELSANQPVGLLAARLSDVAQDDKATRVTYGVLNLTHREGHEEPKPLSRGKRFRVRLRLNGVAHVFPRGHRLRLALSTSYWPLAWPPPESCRLSVTTGKSSFHLPVRAPRPDDAELRPFEPPVATPATPTTQLEERHLNWLVHRDLALDESTLEVILDHGRIRHEDTGIAMSHKTIEKYTTRGDDFGSPRGEVVTHRSFDRGSWEVSIRTRTILTCDREAFRIRAEIDAYEGDTRVHSESWDRRIPRRLV